MARPITGKTIQVIDTCVCGRVEVYPDEFLMPYKDFKEMQVKRKKDKKTGKPFLLMHLYYETCICNENPFEGFVAM